MEVCISNIVGEIGVFVDSFEAFFAKNS
jgi:hypothetical protein